VTDKASTPRSTYHRREEMRMMLGKKTSGGKTVRKNIPAFQTK